MKTTYILPALLLITILLTSCEKENPQPCIQKSHTLPVPKDKLIMK
ncbi:hypothetical protein [Pedobacter sp. Leaf170]|nr:hypothetical protein [Pedobacter sp. Leaf170]